MKLNSILPSLVLALAVRSGGNRPSGSVPNRPRRFQSRRRACVPVVLELFHIGRLLELSRPQMLCSQELLNSSRWAGADVIALEEHVDYWDHQGWVRSICFRTMDTAPTGLCFTVPDHGVYTPQLVVNGRFGFVGSRAGETYRAITGADGAGSHGSCCFDF